MRRLVPVVALLVLAGCNWFAPPDYAPLGTGDIWTYEGTDNSGAFTQTSTVVKSVTCPNNKPGWQVDEKVTRGQNSQTTTVYRCRTDDQYLEFADTAKPAYLILLELPITEGEEWTVGFDIINNRTRGRVMGLEDLDLPYGKVRNCYKIQYEYQLGAISLISYVWYGPNLGRVKWTASGDENLVTELVSFKD